MNQTDKSTVTFAIIGCGDVTEIKSRPGFAEGAGQPPENCDAARRSKAEGLCRAAWSGALHHRLSGDFARSGDRRGVYRYTAAYALLLHAGGRQIRQSRVCGKNPWH